jgi:hypothetical protein
MPKKLLHLEIEEVSLVSEPADKRRFLITKAAREVSKAIQERQEKMTETQEAGTFAFIQKLAKQRIAWGDHKTMPEAIEAVTKSHPDLYERYLREQQENAEKEQRQRKYASDAAWRAIETRAKDMVAKGQAQTRACRGIEAR